MTIDALVREEAIELAEETAESGTSGPDVERLAASDARYELTSGLAHSDETYNVMTVLVDALPDMGSAVS